MSNRALISKDDLTRWASTVAAHNVVIDGRVYSNGDVAFRLSPYVANAQSGDDDFDDRLDGFAKS